MSDSQKKNMSAMLQWSDHSNKLLDKLYMQWKNVSFCDLNIISCNKHLEAHAWLLCAFSSRVAAHISNCTSSLVGRKLSPPYIMEVKYSDEVIKAIITALYTGVFCPPFNLLPETYAAVQWFDIPELRELLENQFDASDLALPVGIELSSETVENNNVCSNAVVKLEELSLSADSTDIDLQHCIVTSSIPEPNFCNEPNSDRRIKVRRTARKHKSKSCRYNQEVFVIDPPRKEKPLKKSNQLGVNNSTVISNHIVKRLKQGVMNKSHTRLQINEEKDTVIDDDDECENYSDSAVLQSQNDPAISQLSAKVSLNKKSVDKIPEKKTKKQRTAKTAKTSNSSERPQEVSKKQKVSAAKEKKEMVLNPNNVSGGYNKTTAVIEEVSDTDPIKGELDLLIGDLRYKKCEKCLKKFSIEQYAQHIIDHPVFSCQDCSKVFYRKVDHTKHQRDKHTGRPWLKCRHCEFYASRQSELKKHSVDAHQDPNPFVCSKEDCDFKTHLFNRLETHMKIHSNEKEFSCEKCGKCFFMTCSLVYHQRACFHLQPFLCDLCGQSFNHPHSMQLHRRTVHFGEKPFTCKVCSHSFSDHRNMRRHMRIHENSFPYSCPVCHQQFRHSNTLKMHLTSKHKEAGDIFVKDSQLLNKHKDYNYKRAKVQVATLPCTDVCERGNMNRKKGKKTSEQKTFHCASEFEEDLPCFDEARLDSDNGIDLVDDVRMSHLLDNYPFV